MIKKQIQKRKSNTFDMYAYKEFCCVKSGFQEATKNNEWLVRKVMIPLSYEHKNYRES